MNTRNSRNSRGVTKVLQLPISKLRKRGNGKVEEWNQEGNWLSGSLIHQTKHNSGNLLFDDSPLLLYADIQRERCTSLIDSSYASCYQR